MATEQPVFENKATYFSSSTKKWNSGTFTLRENFFQFRGQEDDSQQNIRIPLSTISGLEKRQSSFIYAAIVISVGAEKHWFASFPNRDTVYNLLELFWRGSLLSTPYKSSSPNPKPGGTPLGKELLGILHESECNLVNAANALANQGRQIQESQTVMEDINKDLNVAEKFLRTFSHVQSILSILNFKESKPKMDDQVQSVEEEVRQKHFKVTYTLSKTKNVSWEKGTLIIADEVLLLDEHQNRKIMINDDNLEKFQIITPWEFCLVYSSGSDSKTCYVLCPQLSSLLKFLYTIPPLQNKIVYAEDPVDDTVPSISGTSSNHQPGSSSPLPPVRTRSDLFDAGAAQLQTVADEDMISDGDIEEISNYLNNLRAVASEVSREQKHQMEQIDSLISDVDKTELRIHANNKNIKKAM